jgi:hypothetical protein
MRRFTTLLLVVATAAGASACSTHVASEVLNKAHQDEHLLKENDRKIEEGLKKLREATDHTKGTSHTTTTPR